MLFAVNLQTAWRTQTSVLLNNEQTSIEMGCRFHASSDNPINVLSTDGRVETN